MRVLALACVWASVALTTAVAHAAKPANSAVPAGDALLQAAVNGAHRSADDRARDVYRHPVETLQFFGIRPNMTVVEVSPGGGWYTEILAPYLRDKGHYVAAHNNPEATGGALKAREAFVARLQANPALYGKVSVTSFGRGIEGHLAEPGSADMVLTFRNVHNWAMGGFAPQAFQAFFTALKPGGILGVVDHRLPEDRAETPESKKSGYLKQSDVIRMAEAAGFTFVAASEVNANPKDTADHPSGVWTLPPANRSEPADRAKYQAIGESDRMTLRFVKPAN